MNIKFFPSVRVLKVNNPFRCGISKLVNMRGHSKDILIRYRTLHLMDKESYWVNESLILAKQNFVINIVSHFFSILQLRFVYKAMGFSANIRMRENNART